MPRKVHAVIERVKVAIGLRLEAEGLDFITTPRTSPHHPSIY